MEVLSEQQLVDCDHEVSLFFFFLACVTYYSFFCDWLIGLQDMLDSCGVSLSFCQLVVCFLKLLVSDWAAHQINKAPTFENIDLKLYGPLDIFM